jgi:hypothetical protein
VLDPRDQLLYVVSSARLPPAILNEVLMLRIRFVILALSLVLALRAVEAQQALRELDDALAGIRC